MLHDPDVDVRITAVSSLAELKSSPAVAALREALQDDTPEVSFAAAKALWSLHDPAGRQALMAVLEGENKTSSGFFSKQKREALRTIRTPRTLLLLALNRGVRLAPVPYVGLGMTSMQELLSDPGISGRATAALMLAHEKGSATLGALRNALGDKEWSVRAAAVHALAVRKDSRLNMEVVPLLEDENEAVRLRAAAAFLGATVRK
jgi:HEAT repeat protein